VEAGRSMRGIRTVEDVLALLDAMFDAGADRWTERGAAWWDGFYDDRGRGIPFFRQVPDESLVAWHRDGRLPGGVGRRALDVGCGPGRNALWLAGQGYRVDAVDVSGCFHHLPPHRRISYRAMLARALAPDGAFGLACFAWGAMGSQEPDASYYRDGRLAGGLAYTDGDLRRIFDWLDVLELRRMRQLGPESDLFGESFLWAGLFSRRRARPDVGGA